MKIKNLKIKIAIALTLVVAGVVGFKTFSTSQKANYVAENTATNTEKDNSTVTEVSESEDTTQEDPIQYDEEDEPSNEDYYQLGEDESVADLEKEIQETKQYIQDEYGTDNEFQTVYETETEKEEINPVTGEDRITDKKTNKIEVNNYFEQLNKALEEAKARESAK